MNYYVIILGVVVLVLLYFLYVNYISKTTVLNPLVNLNSSVNDIKYVDLVKRDSTRYSYGVWIYVNSWSSQNLKPIISRGISTKQTELSGDLDFTLYLDNSSPSLKCMINSDPTTTTSITNRSIQPSIEITNNFPIQKWTYVIVSVDNSIIDFYLDGKLVLSRKLDYVPTRSSKDVSIGGTIRQDIFLANIVRNPYPIDPQTAWNTYLSGNGQNNSSNLNINLAVLQNNVEQKRFTLF